MRRFVRTAAAVIFAALLSLSSAGSPPAAHGQTAARDPEAYLRQDDAAAPNFYVEVYMFSPLAPGRSAADIRATLRDTDKGRLLSTAVTPSPEGDSNFRIAVTDAEAKIIEQMQHYVVFVDSYPAATGDENNPVKIVDKQIKVAADVSVKVEANPSCVAPNQPFSITVTRETDFPYALRRFEEVRNFLARPDAPRHISAQVLVKDKALVKGENPADRALRSVTLLPSPGGLATKILAACVELAPSPPAGKSELSLSFLMPAPFELRRQTLRFELSNITAPDLTEKRTLEDFVELGVALTSSVKNEKQDDGTTARERTTRGTLDLFFAPILNLRRVKAIGDGGVVHVFTPFSIDAKVSTGKITEDTLAVNTIDLASTYELRHYPSNTNAYPDLLRHSFSLKNSSDRDFKQAEWKFAYEFQPIFGAINQPLGSAPDVIEDEGKPRVVPNENDRFGLQIIPVLGVELGRTYRVRDPADFEGVSRNVRRFYFGADMIFELTKHLRLSLTDRFYVRGESPDDRGRHYFSGSVEAPLIAFSGGEGRRRAAHALFFSFERGDKPPFSNPAVNVLKFGYRVRARGAIINNR
jgi:hypothetical protein